MKMAMRRVASMGVVSVAIAASAFPAQAQLTLPTELSTCAKQAIVGGTEKITALGRAKNLARQTVESVNGGLSVYQTDATMHGTVSDAVCVDNGDGTWTFTVKGGEPGFTTPSKETVVTVDSNTWTVKVDYNGSVRS